MEISLFLAGAYSSRTARQNLGSNIEGQGSVVF